VRFLPTQIDGVVVVELEPRGDERGWFARTWCAEEFGAAGLPTVVSQTSTSYNAEAGTVRGLHRQAPPHHEAKLVRCVAGAILDVAVDVRPDSPTYLRHVAVELSAADGRALQLPAYVAHGYQTLEPHTVVSYQMDGPYTPTAEQGWRHDDPAFGIEWPLPVRDLSPKDRAWPAYAVGHDDVREAGER